MYKYEKLKRYNHGYCIQVYMYAFVYIDPDIMTEDDYFPDTNTFVENLKN